MVGIYCAVKNCYGSNAMKHRFPNPAKNPDLFNKWVQLCDNDRLIKEYTSEKIYTNCRVCHLHFAQEDIGRSNKLLPNAFPKLGVSDPQKTTDKSSSDAIQPDKSITALDKKEKKTAEENVSQTYKISSDKLTEKKLPVNDIAIVESTDAGNLCDVDTYQEPQSINVNKKNDSSWKAIRENVHAELLRILGDDVPDIPVAKPPVKNTEKKNTQKKTYNKVLPKEVTEPKSQVEDDIATLELSDTVDLCDNDIDEHSQIVDVNEKNDSSHKAISRITPTKEDIIFLTPENISTVCRICLKQKLTVHLFKSMYEEHSLGEILEICSTIKLKEDDNLSQYICQTCIDELLQAYSFRQKCVKSEETLLNFKTELAKSQKEKEDAREKHKKLTLRFHDYENILNEEDIINITNKSEDDFNDNIKSTDDQNQRVVKRRFYLLKANVSEKGGTAKNVSLTEIDQDNAESLISNNHETTMSLKVGNNVICDVKTAMVQTEKNENGITNNVNTPDQSNKSMKNKNLKRRKMMLYSQLIRPALYSIIGRIPNSCILKKKRRRKRNQNKILKLQHEKVVIPGTCKICNEQYNTVQEYQEHSRLTKHYFNPCVCKSCGKIFPHKHSLKMHWIMRHDSRRLHMCEKCGKCYKTRGYLSKHIKTHTQKKYVCRLCGLSRLTLKEIIHHRRINHPSIEKKHCCEKCGKVYAKPDSLRHHRNYIHLKIKSNFCDICGKGFQYKSKLKKHMLTHATEQFKCRLCNRSFKKEHNYFQHIKAQHPGADENTKEEDEIQVIECTFCDVFCSNKQLQSMHIKEDHEANMCIYCDTLFYTEEELENHRTLLHTDISDFSCRYCGRCFSESCLLSAHLDIHRTKCYQCAICFKKFVNNRALKTHNLSHTQEKRYKCQYCDKAFVYSTNRVIHERIHTGERPFVCEICGKGNICSSSYKRHRRTHLIPSYSAEVEIECTENKMSDVEDILIEKETVVCDE